MKMSEHHWFQVPSWELSVFPWEVGPAFIIYTKHDCVWHELGQSHADIRKGRLDCGWLGTQDLRM